MPRIVAQVKKVTIKKQLYGLSWGGEASPLPLYATRFHLLHMGIIHVSFRYTISFIHLVLGCNTV